jgi:dimethylargininase
MTQGLRSDDMGVPEHELALHQHGKYVEALIACGLNVRVMAADENYPDSTFVEDTALLTSEVAIIANPGAPSRQGEILTMNIVINEYYDKTEVIQDPGTLDAGDVMMAGKQFFIGLSERTNKNGAEQLINILMRHGMSGSIIEFSGMLHLKSGISYLENNNLLAVDMLAPNPGFADFNIIPVPGNESYAANSLWINEKVLVPEGYPETLENIRKAGYETIVLNTSEFRKLDGGLSCLSLRF